MKRVVIMCQGQQDRLRDLPIPKSLLPLNLCGTTILERTIKMVYADREVGEILLVAPHRVFNRVSFGFTSDEVIIALDSWLPITDPECSHNGGVCGTLTQFVRVEPTHRVRVHCLTMGQPGNSIIAGLGLLTRYLGSLGTFYSPPRDLRQTTILLGDVVYSRRCLVQLLDRFGPIHESAVAPPIWFASSPDLTPSSGELYGVTYAAHATSEFLSCLGAIKPPPHEVDTYQPGRLRELLWEYQARQVRGDRRPQLPKVPDPLYCAVMDGTDYTKDIDTVYELVTLLGALDLAAFSDHD